MKEYYRLIATTLSKQQKLEADTKLIQQINIIENLGKAGKIRMFLIIEEAKETVLYYSKRTTFF